MRIAIAAVWTACLAGAESLHYSINWASGLNLGEATLDASQGGARWNFQAGFNASLPGYAIKDSYSSTANPEFCSIRLEKNIERGKKKVEERISFDQSKQEATRETAGGGKSTVNTAACARDPLALLQFIRKELAEGRLASRHTVVFGSQYQVQFEYAGVQQVQLARKPTEAERVQTTVKGPASDFTFDLFFARDATRTPLMARIPSPLGAFIVELMR